VTVLFDVTNFDQVAKLMHPRRCRQLTLDQRERLVEAGAKYRFKPGVQNAPEPRPCVPTGLDGLGTTPEVPDISGALVAR
jgi:hypothetical protein